MLSVESANSFAAFTTYCIKLNKVPEGSLNGKGCKDLPKSPAGLLTSLHSPGAIGSSGANTRSPCALNPPGKFANVPASTNCLIDDVAVLVKPPIKCKYP